MEEPKKIRVIVADDHRLFRSGVMSLLEDEREIFVIGEAKNGEELVNLYFEKKPDLLLVDISMPFLSGIEAVKEIRKKDRSVKALFLSMHDSEEYIYNVMKVGGLGLISKNVMKGELVYAIKTAYDGNQYFGQSWSAEKLRDLKSRFEFLTGTTKKEDGVTLTPREREILKLIGDGLTSQEIAQKIHLSKRTIDSHRAHLLKKLGVSSLSELMKYAIKYSQMYSDDVVD